MKFPLWKLRICDSEYQGLKKELSQACDEDLLEDYSKEAALFYAEWWRREYSGGFPSRERVAFSAGVRDSNRLFQLAKRAMLEWKCKVYGINRHEYFYSLLLQGGLPMNHIQNAWGNYTNFLEHAMIELVSMGVTNWEDTSIFEGLDCVRFLPPSFRNDCIYSISMLVVRSIVEDKADILPYDIKEERFKTLNSDLHRVYEKRRRSNPLAFSWNLKLENGKARLFYQLNALNEIRSDVLSISTSVFRFEVHVAGKFLARYTRTEHNEDYSVYTCQSKDQLVHEWKGEQFVPVKIIQDNGEDLLIPVKNCYAPDFSSPQKFIKNGDSYVQHGAASEDGIIIFDENWSAIDGNDVTPIELNGEQYFLASFSDNIRLQNKDGRVENFDNSFSSFHTEYRYKVASWCVNNTENFLTSAPIITVFNDNGETVSRDVVKTYKSRSGNGEWQPLNELNGAMPGFIQIKVKFPDGKDEIRSFFFIGDLSYTSENESLYDANIKWKCSSHLVRISIMDVEGINITENGDRNFHLHRNDETQKFPSVCPFVITAPACPSIKIVISSPFKGLAVLDSEGKEIAKDEVICAQNLYNYNLFAHGIGTITIKMTYISNDIENTKSLMIQRPSNGLMLLSDINDLLDRLFMLYEKRSFNRGSYIKISINDRSRKYQKEFRVRRYSLDTKPIENKRCMVMKIDDDPDDDIYTIPEDYDGQLMACAVGCDSDKMKAYAMDKTENCTQFLFPDIEDINQFIVFSNKNDAARVIPRYYNLEKLNLTISQRINIRKERLPATEKNLLEAPLDSNPWAEVFSSYKIVTENSLIFSTFDCFIAIAHNPQLIAKFVLGLCYHGYSDNSISDFNRYAAELAFSLHWVRTECWENVLQEISNLDNLSQQYLMNDVIKFMADVFKTELYQTKATDFATYITSGKIMKAQKFYSSDLRDYRMSIHGVTDTGQDLPTIEIRLNDYIFPSFTRDTLRWQKVAMLSPLKIAELITSKYTDCEFWTDENDSLRRVINFYRVYATKTYSNILMKAISIYSNKQ